LPPPSSTSTTRPPGRPRGPPRPRWRRAGPLARDSARSFDARRLATATRGLRVAVHLLMHLAVLSPGAGRDRVGGAPWPPGPDRRVEDPGRSSLTPKPFAVDDPAVSKISPRTRSPRGDGAGLKRTLRPAKTRGILEP
jgi:hypothetical protein